MLIVLWAEGENGALLVRHDRTGSWSERDDQESIEEYHQAGD